MMQDWLRELEDASNIRTDADANKFIHVITKLNDDIDLVQKEDFIELFKVDIGYIPVMVLNKFIFDFESLHNLIKSMPFQTDIDTRMLCQLQRFTDHLKKGRNLLYEL